MGKRIWRLPLGVTLAERGQRVYFTTTIDLVEKLTKALSENRLPRAIKNLTRPKLLIIDEVGYLKLDKTQASLLFQVISGRYELESATIMTSNKAFGEWGDVFAGDAVMASAALDRLLHRSTVLNINGDSYRMLEKKKAGIKLTEEVKKRRLSCLNLFKTKARVSLLRSMCQVGQFYLHARGSILSAC